MANFSMAIHIAMMLPVLGLILDWPVEVNAACAKARSGRVQDRQADGLGADSAHADDLVLAVGIELVVAAIWIEGQTIGRDLNPHLQRPSFLVQGSRNQDQLAQFHPLREGEG